MGIVSILETPPSRGLFPKSITKSVSFSDTMFFVQNCLRELRLEKGLSQEAVGNAIGATKSQISKMENGEQQLGEKWIQKFTKFYDVTPNRLFYPPDIMEGDDEAHQIAKRVEAVVRVNANYADMFKTLLDGAEARVAEKKP